MWAIIRTMLQKQQKSPTAIQIKSPQGIVNLFTYKQLLKLAYRAHDRRDDLFFSADYAFQDDAAFAALLGKGAGDDLPGVLAGKEQLGGLVDDICQHHKKHISVLLSEMTAQIRGHDLGEALKLIVADGCDLRYLKGEIAGVEGLAVGVEYLVGRFL